MPTSSVPEENMDNSALATTSVLVNLDGTYGNENGTSSPRTPPDSVVPGSAAAVRRHVLSLDLQAPRDIAAVRFHAHAH